MRIFRLHRQQLIERPRQEVFAFFERPDNLRRITPTRVGFELLTPLPITMRVGTALDYTIRLLGIPIRWTTLISQYDPPNRFCDIALRGPYSFWHHTHTFTETDRGTLMVDEVHYALPLGPLGRLVHWLWVKRQLRQIFDFRARVIDETLGRADSPDSRQVSP